MKIYCMSDIHGCYSALCDALELVIDHLDEPDTKLIFLGDYIHGGEDNIAVLKKIMGLQNIYGHGGASWQSRGNGDERFFFGQ